MLNGAAHRGFDEITEGLVFGEHGVELSAQFRFDTDLGDDSGFHGRNVVNLFDTHYLGFRKGPPVRKAHRARPNRLRKF